MIHAVLQVQCGHVRMETLPVLGLLLQLLCSAPPCTAQVSVSGGLNFHINTVMNIQYSERHLCTIICSFLKLSKYIFAK